MNDKRADPSKLLEQIQAQERQDKIGKLKIYLGAAPGVGKTYTMLKDAKAKRAQGLDVVIGVVESHGRTDIIELMQGLETLPKQTIEYRGKILEDFNLDAALKRNPGLILIDEMAHSNPDSFRHAKRWQDIKELLDRGIDVYTTLNVQHIESLNDDVSSIIHAPINETVPDMMLDLADTIELIDLPPEDLLKRLQEGKVYFPEQAELAAEGFFRKGNLIALRELALRVTAERVGAQVLLYRQGLGIKHIWSTNEKILVCVGDGSESLQLIRTARRLATSLQADWIAVHVDSPRAPISEEQRNRVVKHLQVASRLGAETTILQGYDLVSTIMEYAREQNVTLIMTWKQIRPRWQDIFHFRLSDELVRHSQEINVYIMTGNRDAEDQKVETKKSGQVLRRIYLYAFGITAITTGINFLLFKLVDPSILILLYLISVTIVSLFGRVGPSIIASVLSVFCYGLFFLPTMLIFSSSALGYLSTLVVMILLTQVISHLTIIMRRQAMNARSAEHQTAALHKLSRQLASARGVNKLLEIGAVYIADVFNSEVMALLPEENGLEIKVSTHIERHIDDKEKSVAQWVFDLGQIAGLGTDTLPLSKAMYLPLIASQGTVGVLRICPRNPDLLFTPEQMDFLETCTHQIALAIEVDRLQEVQQEFEIEQKVDHTRNALLQSVSQDLRAPLASIMLSASTQMQLAKELNPESIIKLGNTIYNEAEQLSRLINNLLQLTYLESNAAVLQKSPISVKDLINKVLKALRSKIAKTPIYIKIPADLPDIPLDRVLLEGVMFNLLDNALKFAPPEKPIEIYAFMEANNGMLTISIADHGPGVMEDEIARIFEKFYRGRDNTVDRGLGLGLAICRMIVEAHGGRIWVENRPEGGAEFKVSLKLS